jgi:DHA1 family multidrug resistance protein-like MFS transporter
MAVLNYLGDAYPDHVASVYAGNDLFRSGFGAAFPLFANAMFSKLGLDWGNSLLGFVSLVFIPVIFYLWKNGETIRHKSKNARHDL